MIKLQDFASKYGVTDRQVQRLLKKHEDEMTGHFERKGSNGTWIDETGERILRSKMRQAPVIVHDTEVGQKIAHLEQENEVLKNKLLLAYEKMNEQQALLNDATASKFMLQAAEKEVSILEGFLKEAKENIEHLQEEKENAVKEKQEEIDQLKAELQAEKSKTIWQKLRGK